MAREQWGGNKFWEMVVEHSPPSGGRGTTASAALVAQKTAGKMIG
jgi:hypothetical protein